MKLLVNRMKSRINCYLKEFEIIPIRQKVYRVICFLAIIYAGIGLINNTFFSNSRELNVIIAVLCIILSFYLCYIYRLNIGLFIVMILIAYANYSICMMYLDSRLMNGVLHGQFGLHAYSESLFCVYLFVVCLLLFSERFVKEPSLFDSKAKCCVKHRRNDLIGYGSMLVFALVFFLTFDLGANGERGGGSALTEYRTIILIIGSYFTAKKLHTKILWTALVGVTSIVAFLSGSRVDAIATLVALIVIWYSNFLTYKKVCIMLPFFVVAMTVIGSVRGGAWSWNALVDAVKALWETKLTWDTPMFAYVPSLAIVELTPTVDFLDKLSMLGGEILYIFVGSSLKLYTSLITYSRDFYIHYYGCITPVYFYFWFGYAGSILIALLVKMYSSFYQKMTKKDSLSSLWQELKYILSLYFLSNVARWYCYGPTGLLRNMFVCGVAFLVVWTIEFFSKKTWMKMKGCKS